MRNRRNRSRRRRRTRRRTAGDIVTAEEVRGILMDHGLDAEVGMVEVHIEGTDAAVEFTDRPDIPSGWILKYPGGGTEPVKGRRDIEEFAADVAAGMDSRTSRRSRRSSRRGLCADCRRKEAGDMPGDHLSQMASKEIEIGPTERRFVSKYLKWWKAEYNGDPVADYIWGDLMDGYRDVDENFRRAVTDSHDPQATSHYEQSELHEIAAGRHDVVKVPTFFG